MFPYLPKHNKCHTKYFLVLAKKKIPVKGFGSCTEIQKPKIEPETSPVAEYVRKALPFAKDVFISEFKNIFKVCAPSIRVYSINT